MGKFYTTAARWEFTALLKWMLLRNELNVRSVVPLLKPACSFSLTPCNLSTSPFFTDHSVKFRLLNCLVPTQTEGAYLTKCSCLPCWCLPQSQSLLMTFLVSKDPTKRVQDEASTFNQMNHILNSIDCLDRIFTIQVSSEPNSDGDILGEMNPVSHVNSMNML